MNDLLNRLRSALSGRYSIEREIGQGGMATVYLAHDVRHDRNVALKVLRPELAAVVGAERFLAEIKTTANLQHPHILPLFDSGEADSFLYYVMPYVEGENLRGRIDREKQLGVDEAVVIARKVADALDYAHDHGVVHRDIKPANILLSERGEPLVADFGIALAVAHAGGGRITETGLSLGTPHYMSPEQATGDRDVDPRSDVYSLACVLYEMLAGQPPFHAPTAQAVLVRVLTADVAPITMLRRTVPAHVEGALVKGLEKLPADRFESAAAFAKALADPSFRYEPKAATTGSMLSPTAAGAEPARAWYRDLRVVASLTLAVVMTLIALVPDREATLPAFAIRSAVDVAGVLDPGDIVISPDGSRFVIEGLAEDGTRGLFLRGAGDEFFQQIPGTEGGAQPVFSPDGQWVAFRRPSAGAILKVAVLGGAPRPVVEDHDLDPRVPDWGDSGYIYFRGRRGQEIFRVPDTGGQPELVYEADFGVNNIRVLPGGRAVMFTDLNVDRTMVYDIDSQEMTEIIVSGSDARYVETGHLVYTDGNQGLWAVPFDPEELTVTGNPVPVLTGLTTFLGTFANFGVSRDGTLVYEAGGGAASGLAPIQELVVVPFDGEESLVPLEPRALRNVAWSPDGRSLAFAALEPGVRTGQTHVFVYNVELRTATRQLTFEGTQGWPRWSPDGSRLVYTSSDAEGGGPMGSVSGADLYVKAVYDDSDPVRILEMDDNQYPYDWADEDRILFTNSVGASSDLVIAEPEPGAEAVVYLDIDEDLGAVDISPDGRFAAFASNESGIFEVYVRSFPEPRQPVLVSRGGGDRPRWSPSGDAIYYWKDGGATAADSLMRAEVESEPTFAPVRTSTVLVGEYAVGTWDLHPDGDRIVIGRSAATQESDDEARPRYVLVVNWFEELRAALGGSR
jgi:serine/threonine-protein kinase